MTVTLSEHAAALLEAVRAQRHEPVDSIVEHALEVLAREEHVQVPGSAPNEAQRQAAFEMLEFAKSNRARLDPGISVRDLIHESHRI